MLYKIKIEGCGPELTQGNKKKCQRVVCFLKLIMTPEGSIIVDVWELIYAISLMGPFIMVYLKSH